MLSVVTLLVGLVAFIVYQKQQNDRKKDAATIVLLEIQNATDRLKAVNESIVKDKLIKEDTLLMPTARWEKYKYLFVRNFNSRELNEITTFYEKCLTYDKIVRYHSSFFVKNEEQVRNNLQSSLAIYTRSYLAELAKATTANKKKTAYEEYKKLIDTFASQFMSEISSNNGNNYFYLPKKTITDAEAITATVRPLSSDIRTRFENIINKNLRTAIFDYILGKRISQI
jgi:hypothetical protein